MVAVIPSDKMEFEMKSVTEEKDVYDGKMIIMLVILILTNTYKVITICHVLF